MAVVTVLGASGTVISVPFKSAANAAFARQLAYQISTAIKSGTLTGGDPNPAALAFTGNNELVIGGTSSVGGAPNSNYYPLTNAYSAVVNNANSPVTISAGIQPLGPFSVLAGTGGTTFFSNNSTIGGTIALGGGANTIAGVGTFSGAVTSANGGLQGDWTISTGSGAPGDTDAIYLSTGTDQILSGVNDTISAGGASVVDYVLNTDVDGGTATQGHPTFFIGSANSTVFGVSAANVSILGDDGATGGGVYVLGSGGNGVIAAGAGNSTLVGGGPGDVLYASTAPGAQALMFAGAGNETLEGAISGGSSTLYGGAGDDVLAAGNNGPDVIAAGSGVDTIYAGLGADSIWFYKPVVTSGNQDIINNFQTSTNTLIISGYTSFTESTGSTPLTITLSDNTTITFNGLTGSQANLLKIQNYPSS